MQFACLLGISFSGLAHCGAGYIRADRMYTRIRGDRWYICVAQFVLLGSGSIGSAGRVVLLCQCVISLPPPVSLPPRLMPTTPIPTIGPPYPYHPLAPWPITCAPPPLFTSANKLQHHMITQSKSLGLALALRLLVLIGYGCEYQIQE